MTLQPLSKFGIIWLAWGLPPCEDERLDMEFANERERLKKEALVEKHEPQGVGLDQTRDLFQSFKGNMGERWARMGPEVQVSDKVAERDARMPKGRSQLAPTFARAGLFLDATSSNIQHAARLIGTLLIKRCSFTASNPNFPVERLRFGSGAGTAIERSLTLADRITCEEGVEPAAWFRCKRLRWFWEAKRDQGWPLGGALVCGTAVSTERQI